MLHAPSTLSCDETWAASESQQVGVPTDLGPGQPVGARKSNDGSTVEAISIAQQAGIYGFLRGFCEIRARALRESGEQERSRRSVNCCKSSMKAHFLMRGIQWILG